MSRKRQITFRDDQLVRLDAKAAEIKNLSAAYLVRMAVDALLDGIEVGAISDADIVDHIHTEAETWPVRALIGLPVLENESETA